MAKQKFKFNIGSKTDQGNTQSTNNTTPNDVQAANDTNNTIEKTGPVKNEDNIIEANNSNDTTEKENVASKLKKIERAKTETKAFDFRFIPREKIVPNETNDFDQNKVEEIANSILNFGLIHNLEVLYDLEKDIYTITSGETRYRAIGLLIDKYSSLEDTDSDEYISYQRNVKSFENGLPCNVKHKEAPKYDESDPEYETLVALDEIDDRIRLLEANMCQRDYSDKEFTRQKIEEYAILLEKRSNLGKKTLNINKEVAKKLDMSERQVIKYRQVSNLIPELLEEFKNNSITLNEGTNYSKLSEDEQKAILELIKNNNKTAVNELLEDIKTKNSKISDLEKELKENEKLKNELEKEKQKILSDYDKAEAENKEKLAKLNQEMEEALNSSSDSDAIEAEYREKLSELESSQEEIRLEKDKALNELKNKDDTIKDLKKQLNEIEALKNKQIEEAREQAKEDAVKTVKANSDKKIQNLLREEFALKTTLQNFQKNSSELLSTLKRYEKMYDKEIVEEYGLSDIETLKEEIVSLASRLIM